jgi:spore coat polysaccharide biosynthesis protein SpsF
MRSAVVVFARMDSRRLPGKALRLLLGRPMIAWVMDRAAAAGAGEAILATSDRPVDDVLARLAEREGWTCFRGAADDVVGRSQACLRFHCLDSFVRLTGDSPLVDPTLIARLAAAFAENEPDIATNTHPRSFPAGCSIEVMSRACLERVADLSNDPQDREHLTRYIYRHPGAFRIFNVDSGRPELGKLNLSVDTPSDFERTEWIMDRARDPHSLGFDETLDLAAKYPQPADAKATERTTQ